MNVRIVPCEMCQSEGRIIRGSFGDEQDHGLCPFCEGTCSEIIRVHPITMEDLDDYCPA